MAESEPVAPGAMASAPTSAFLGYIRYSGAAVEDGLLDARKAAQALSGLDEAVRLFLAHQAPQLAGVDYEIPVLVRPGSWEALIPETIGQWIATGAGVVLTTYFTTAAKKIAEHDFEDVGIKDVFSKALQAIQWVIRIGKHLGHLTLRPTTGLRWRGNNEEVGIPNGANEYLFVPRLFYEFYLAAHPRVLGKMAGIVTLERVLTIGVRVGRHIQLEEITPTEKAIFTGEEENEDVLFPELTHGLPVVLDGFLTRGNATANTLGFKYQEHILTCHPVDGSIVTYKPLLFGPARLIGTISREDERGGTDAKRPRIMVMRIEPLDKVITSLPLFPDSEDEEPA